MKRFVTSLPKNDSPGKRQKKIISIQLGFERRIFWFRFATGAYNNFLYIGNILIGIFLYIIIHYHRLDRVIVLKPLLGKIGHYV